MSNLGWTTNCILFGAKIALMVKGEREEVVARIKNLSSEFDDTSAEYLARRLEELLKDINN